MRVSNFAVEVEVRLRSKPHVATWASNALSGAGTPARLDVRRRVRAVLCALGGLNVKSLSICSHAAGPRPFYMTARREIRPCPWGLPEREDVNRCPIASVPIIYSLPCAALRQFCSSRFSRECLHSPRSRRRPRPRTFLPAAEKTASICARSGAAGQRQGTASRSPAPSVDIHYEPTQQSSVSAR